MHAPSNYHGIDAIFVSRGGGCFPRSSLSAREIRHCRQKAHKIELISRSSSHRGKPSSELDMAAGVRIAVSAPDRFVKFPTSPTKDSSR